MRDKKQSAELIRQLCLTPYSREEFQQALYVSRNSVEDARRYFIRTMQGFAGYNVTPRRVNSWRSSRGESRKGVGIDANKFRSKIERLNNVVERLLDVQIENRSYEYVLQAYDSKEAFHFLDPPYLVETRTGSDDYEHDFTLDDHKKMAGIANELTGKTMVCGYNCDTMKKLYPSDRWQLIPGPDRNTNLGKSKTNRECVWVNYQVTNVLTLFT